MPDRTHGSASPSGGADPRSEQVRIELVRIERRWAGLPLAAAEEGMPVLRRALDALARALGQAPVPDLGPGTALHQLKVLVWEAAGCSDGAPHGEGGDSGPGAVGIPDLAGLLAGVRRELS